MLYLMKSIIRQIDKQSCNFRLEETAYQGVVLTVLTTALNDAFRVLSTGCRKVSTNEHQVPAANRSTRDDEWTAG